MKDVIMLILMKTEIGIQHFDDLGEDGLGPEDDDYPGPDIR